MLRVAPTSSTGRSGRHLVGSGRLGGPVRLAAVALGLSQVLGAQPALARPPKAFTEQLKKGRALEAKGKFAEAAAAFAAALRVAPGDPTALTELGLAQYKQKDLKNAEASTRAALARMAELHPPDDEDVPVGPVRIARGQALYNLGRVLEDAGDKPGAIKAYRDSHDAYPRAIVRNRLAKLDAASAAELDPFHPSKMDGPFTSVEAVCKSLETASDAGSCSCGDAATVKAGNKPGAPFEQVAAFARRCEDDQANQELEVAVKVASGWYLTAAQPSESDNSVAFHCPGANWIITGLTMAKSTLRLDYRTTTTCARSARESWGWDESATIVIGVGPSGMPSATPAITTSWDELPGHHHNVKAKLTWTDDTVEVTGKFADKPDVPNLSGKHKLVFP